MCIRDRFTGQYSTESIAIAYAKSEYPDEKPVPAYFRFDTVAVENDSISDFYLTSFAGGQLAANIARYPDMQAAMTALNGGETKAAMGPLGQLEYGLTEATDVHQPPLAGFAVSKWTLGVGVNFRFRPLSYAVDDAIYAALEEGSGLSGDALLFTDDRIDNINAAKARGWQTHHFTGPDGWADRLVAAGLLTEAEAA